MPAPRHKSGVITQLGPAPEAASCPAVHRLSGVIGRTLAHEADDDQPSRTRGTDAAQAPLGRGDRAPAQGAQTAGPEAALSLGSQRREDDALLLVSVGAGVALA